MGTEITIRPLTAADAAFLKHLRLTALQDTPTAFGSTYAHESAFSDEDWKTKAATWSNGTTGTCWIALDGDAPVGIAAGYIAADAPNVVNLVSMWTSSTHRRRGIGGKLVARVEEWAKSVGVPVIQLHVTEGNTAAIELYKRCGFEFTGEREQHQAHPGEIVAVMRKSTGSPRC